MVTAGRAPLVGTPSAPLAILGPLSRDERLLEHCFAYLIGSCNLLLINLAQSPERLWSLPVIGLWTVALAVHCFVFWVLPRHGTGHESHSPTAEPRATPLESPVMTRDGSATPCS